MKNYIYSQRFFFDLRSFHSLRHMTISPKPYRVKIDISFIYCPILMFEYSKCLSGKFKMGLLNRLFQSVVHRKRFIKKCIFYILKYAFYYLVSPPVLWSKILLTNPSLIFLTNILSTQNQNLLINTGDSLFGPTMTLMTLLCVCGS